MAGKKGMRQYPAEPKIEAVQQFYSEGKTCRQIAHALGVPDRGRVKLWLWQYRRKGFEGF